MPSLLTALLKSRLSDSSGVSFFGGGHLRFLVVTGEPLEPELCRSWLALFPDVPLVNAYGPAECSDDVTHHVISAAPDPKALRVPIGHPIPNAELMVVNDAFRVLPRDGLGEIVIGGICVGAGYSGDLERSALAFVNDPRSMQLYAR